jgi:hypothetical protein
MRLAALRSCAYEMHHSNPQQQQQQSRQTITTSHPLTSVRLYLSRTRRTPRRFFISSHNAAAHIPHTLPTAHTFTLYVTPQATAANIHKHL